MTYELRGRERRGGGTEIGAAPSQFRRTVDRSVRGSSAGRRADSGGAAYANEYESRSERRGAHRPDRRGRAADRPIATRNVSATGGAHNSRLELWHFTCRAHTWIRKWSTRRRTSDVGARS